MSLLLRSAIGVTTIGITVLLAQPADQTAAKEGDLKKSLFLLRQAIDKYTGDQHRAPQRLQDLIAKGYVTSIPTDPFTGSNSTWRLAMKDAGKARRAGDLRCA